MFLWSYGLISPIIVQMKILLQGRLPLGCRTWLGAENLMDEVDLRVGAGECHSDSLMCHFRTWHLGTCKWSGGFRWRLILSLCSGGLLVIKSRTSSQVRLIASKTRVAPLKKQTIPRLELSAALILARLTACIKTTLKQCLVIDRVRCWTDSKNVLY